MKGPWRELGVSPDAESLVAAFLAEHGADSGWRVNEDGTVEGVVAFGGVDTCPSWPDEAEMVAHRRLTVEVRQ